MERVDVRESHAVLARMVAPDRARVLHGSYGPREVLGLMHHMDLAVGMRLHFLIFAAISGVPFLPLPYASKVSELARMLSTPMPASLGHDAVGPLLAAIDQVWDERQEYGSRLQGRLEKLKPRAAGTLQHVTDLLAHPSSRPPARRGQQPQQQGVLHAPVDPSGRSEALDVAPALSVAGG
jgi:polysaccharide pyruvyl transferase WcaK-like protein